MKSIIRKDEAAVSPVIATILMVAITVVLAAVLYVMVSGLLTPTGQGPRVMGVNIGTSGDGTNWTLLITTTPTGLTTSAVKLTITTTGGLTRSEEHTLALQSRSDCVCRLLLVIR